MVADYPAVAAGTGTGIPVNHWWETHSEFYSWYYSRIKPFMKAIQLFKAKVHGTDQITKAEMVTK